MRNFVQPGDVVSVTAPAAVAAGAGVLVGSLFGVAVHAAASGAPVEVDLRGIFTLPKTTGEAWTQGVRLYWNAATGAVTTTVATNRLIGVAMENVAAPGTSGQVYLTAAFTL